jgi:protein-S-isoprenylcysteine O-methyltransferase Ste14
MTDDTARWILLAFTAIFPIGVYHRIRARTGEPIDRKQEGWPILLSLRLLALAALVAIIAFMIEPGWMAWSAVPLPGPLRWTGVATGIAGGCLLVWTFRSLGRNLTDTVVTRQNAYLVTHGPYRWVRHPFYLAFALCMLTNALITANAFIAATGLAAFLVMVARTSIEERKLVERFGDAYREYMRSTGRFWPRVR